MSEHFVIKNIRRSIAEARSRKGMIVGLPEIRIAASHAEVLLREIDRLTEQLDTAKSELSSSQALLAEAKTANLAIRSERDQAVAQLHADLAEARAENEALKRVVSSTERWENLDDQLQQAHRSGWEQCQREAKEIANGKPKQWLDKDFVVESAASAMSKEIADAIAAMEYTHKEG